MYVQLSHCVICVSEIWNFHLLVVLERKAMEYIQYNENIVNNILYCRSAVAAYRMNFELLTAWRYCVNKTKPGTLGVIVKGCAVDFCHHSHSARIYRRFRHSSPMSDGLNGDKGKYRHNRSQRQ